MPKKKKAAAKAAAAAEAGGIKPAAATRSKGNKRSRVIESDIEDERNNEVQSQQGLLSSSQLGAL